MLTHELKGFSGIFNRKEREKVLTCILMRYVKQLVFGKI